MKIDTSGPSFVFDEKTKQTIEEGKNRVTLLQVEEQRLAKLKRTLEGDIVRLEADIAYKNTLIDSSNDKLEDITVNTAECIKELNTASELLDKTKSDIIDRIKAVEEKERTLMEKEKDIVKREANIDERDAVMKAEATSILEERTTLDDKKANLEKLINAI